MSEYKVLFSLQLNIGNCAAQGFFVNNAWTFVAWGVVGRNVVGGEK